MLTYDFTKGEGPLYQKLYNFIKDDITKGVLLPGEKLPSRRSLSENLGISTVTVDNAYDQLVEEGYINAFPKKGYFVAVTMTVSFPKEKKREFKIATKRSKDEYDFDFSSSRLDAESFPFSVWAKLTRENVAGRSDKLLEVSESSGIYELREAIAGHLSSFRGLNVSPDQIVVGAGTEYLYGLIIKLLGKDKKYCVEDPGYRKISQIYETEGVRHAFGRMDESGLLVSELVRTKADIAHISPTHHFPTGITMPIGRRNEIMAWASEKEGRYIVEDDYDSEFRLRGNPIPPMQSMDRMDKVIYINTFSKSLASTIRIGYMVLPEHLAERFYEKLAFYSCTVPTFDQYTLSDFIKKGYFEKHINRMRHQYTRKRESVLEIIKKELDGIDYRLIENDSGLHFILQLFTKQTDRDIEDRLKKSKIKISAVSDYCMETPEKQLQGRFIIDYSNLDVGLLPGALKALRKCL
ncbi:MULTISPECIES: PLP-dependent aminotransferase family protein [Butyrivibrio]|uniref:MocR-like pyridoxine biosynthesis transcription factor PdxR n=1 Tax=Butyrivibrio TaxID=830 RepID=UPI00041CB44C|nr:MULTISPECIES: PLP-dependent aminotransferase family protein [Butyrivibrio]